MNEVQLEKSKILKNTGLRISEEGDMLIVDEIDMTNGYKAHSFILEQPTLFKSEVEKS